MRSGRTAIVTTNADWMEDMGQEKLQEWDRIGRSRETLNNIVADAMREAILSGQFKPGDRLPEPQLAEMFGVSRNPIREALKVLSNEGLVEISPRKGARVPLMSPEELNEIIDLRAELEGISARNAARHCAKDTRQALQALLDEGNGAARRGGHGRAADRQRSLPCSARRSGQQPLSGGIHAVAA